jgi:hypothetical protein
MYKSLEKLTCMWGSSPKLIVALVVGWWRWVVKPHCTNQVLKVVVLLLLSLLDVVEALVHVVKCVHHLILTSLQVGDVVAEIMGTWLMRLLKVLLWVRVVVVL